MKLEQLGRHILVEFYNCDSDILGNHEKIEKIMCEAAIKSNATIVTSCFHKFNPWGVSGAVIIQESHLTNPWIGFDYLENELFAERSESTEVARGMIEKIKNFSHTTFEQVTHKPTA